MSSLDPIVLTPRLPELEPIHVALPRGLTPSRAVNGRLKETPGYLKIGDHALYFVHHKAQGEARGTVILCGPIALEASHAALVWTRWARTLAAAGWNAVRFDWRGSGESAGRFSNMTFRDWEADLHGLYDAVAKNSSAPVVLLGLRGGALLAARAFAANMGAALVLWEAPPSGRAHLMDVLRRKLAADYALGSGARKTREDYVAEIRAGGTVEVEGFPWTQAFWEGFGDVEIPVVTDGRPTLRVSTRTHRLERPPFWQDVVNLKPDVSEWFKATLDFLGGLDRGSEISNCPVHTAEEKFDRIERRILTLRHDRLRLVATHHVARTPSRIAILFGNFGYVPRSGQGGVAVRICDELARAGVHGFRVDLPALGDADGELPEDSEEWFHRVRAGSMTRPILDVMETLSRVYGIEKFVVGGLCAAAITAIFALDRYPRSIAGLVLMEPEFFMAETAPNDAASKDDGRPDDSRALMQKVSARGRSLSRRLMTGWGWMRVIAGDNALGRRLPIPRRLMRRLLWLQRDRLPARTNLPLIAAWQNAVRRRVPILVVTAQGKMRELFFDRVNVAAIPRYDHLVGEDRAIQHVRVPGTNHTFTTGEASERITDLVRNWVKAVSPSSVQFQPSARVQSSARVRPLPGLR